MRLPDILTKQAEHEGDVVGSFAQVCRDVGVVDGDQTLVGRVDGKPAEVFAALQRIVNEVFGVEDGVRLRFETEACPNDRYLMGLDP